MQAAYGPVSPDPRTVRAGRSALTTSVWRMRLGVVDVGSNTVHLLVVDAHRGAQPLPATSHKIELRLSEHVTDDGRIAESGERAAVGLHPRVPRRSPRTRASRR